VTQAVSDKLTAITWQAYRDALYGFVRRRVDDPAAAEDIVQDVLVKAYTQRNTLRKPSRLRPWLFQITRNAIAGHYRALKRPELVAEDLVQSDGAEDEERAARELSECLFPLLETLPTPYRQALELADVERLKQREVAARLGLSLSGAKSRVQRARGLLRDALLNCCSVALDRRGHAMDYRTSNGCGERP
jgi:RNA polymerase sigma-70 factor (ECF subfamily)